MYATAITGSYLTVTLLIMTFSLPKNVAEIVGEVEESGDALDLLDLQETRDLR